MEQLVSKAVDYFNTSDNDGIDLSQSQAVITKTSKTPPNFTEHRLATEAPSGEEVQVSLSNASTWHKFSRQNTEMIVTKVGRRMFPSLSLDIRGLDPAKMYEVYVTLMLADRHTLKYQRGVWLANGQAEIYPPAGCAAGLTYFHPDSPAPGKHWLRQEVSFMRLKLTNKLDCFASEPSRNGAIIFAYSMHKYLPVVHIRELTDTKGPGFYTATTFPGTEFITVTAYQNPELTDLKIQFNPYAKGIRNQGDRLAPVLIDSFRPTVQALQQQQLPSQVQQKVKQECEAKLSRVSQLPVRPPSPVQFGSYPNQSDPSYGRWSTDQNPVDRTVTAASSHRYRPYNVAACQHTAADVNTSAIESSSDSPAPQLPQFPPATNSHQGLLPHIEFSATKEDTYPLAHISAYNPTYYWYLPHGNTPSHQHYYQQVYQQYYPGYYFPQQQQQQQAVDIPHLSVQEHETPQATPLTSHLCSSMLMNGADSSPSGVSFEHVD